MSEYEGALLGMGNPLLDIINDVDQAFLDKYQIKMNNQILAEDLHKPMYQELTDMKGTTYCGGGATQNSIRFAQWMLQIPGATAYMGCVGKDKFADILKDSMDKAGCKAVYQIDETTETGTCATAIKDNERSLVANLAAANNYKVSHVQQPENWAIVEKAKVIYSAGFFITASPESILLVAKHAAQSGQIYCMNLSAPFISEVPPFKETLSKALPYVDFLFGNETEAEAFAKSEGWATEDKSEIALKIAALPKENSSRPRTVVITQGAEPTIIAREGKVETYPVIKVAKESLVDTNGAGDAFVGGFLSQIVLGKDLSQAVKAANFAANVVIQRSGATYPEKCSWTS